MLAIKLQRVGRKHQPSYRLVVAEARSKMAGPPVEDLGSYQSTTKVAVLKKERVTYWLGVGAQPTVTAHNLLVAQGVVSAPKRAVKMAKVVVAAPVAVAPAVEAAPAVEKTEAAEPVATEPTPQPENENPTSAPSEPVI